MHLFCEVYIPIYLVIFIFLQSSWGFNALLSSSPLGYRYLSLQKQFHIYNSIDITKLYSLIQNEPSFDSYNQIPLWLKVRCKDLGYNHPNLVQQTALPLVFEGKDIVLQSQTGSGKTLVFSIPILSKIDPTRSAIQAVIIVPSRELGLQVSATLKQLAATSPKKIMIMSVMEGSQNRRQQLWVVAEPPHIVVGNPKSLQRLVDIGRLRLNSVSFVVLDEVDACLLNTDTKSDLHMLLSRKLSNTFRDGLEVDTYKHQNSQAYDNLVYNDLAKRHRDLESAKDIFRQHRQTIFCSATIPQRQYFASQCLKNGWTLSLPELVHVSSKELVPIQVEHEYVECTKENKLSCIKYLIKKEILKSRDQGLMTFKLMVFINDEDLSPMMSSNQVYSIRQNINIDGSEIFQLVEPIQKMMIESQYGSEDEENITMLAEYMTLDERSAALNRFRDKKSSIIFCTTGCAARGIDVPDITHVIQMNLPDNVEDYIHAAGRVGRNGKSGKSIVMIPPSSDFVIERYSNEIGIPIKKRMLKIKNAKG